MINLLPYEKKSEIRTGHANVIILNYVILLAMAVGVLAILIVGTYFSLTQTRTSALQRVEKSKQDSQQYADTQNDAKKFRDDLATAKQIIENETKYSAVILKIAQTIPSGVVLNTLMLSAETLDTPTTFTASAKSINAALRLKSSLEKHDNLYSDVHFETIDRGDSSGSAYPVQVTVGLTIKSEGLQDEE